MRNSLNEDSFQMDQGEMQTRTDRLYQRSSDIHPIYICLLKTIETITSGFALNDSVPSLRRERVHRFVISLNMSDKGRACNVSKRT